MTDLGERLAIVHERIAAACRRAARDPATVTLLAVSKGHPAARVREALAAGHRVFGENRVQELVSKSAELAGTPARWHLIGSVQTNKVNALLRVAGLELVHGVDRVELADALQERLARDGRALAVLLQVNATGEASKHGVVPAAASALLRHVRTRCPALAVQGLMAMGPLVGDPEPCFEQVANLRDVLRKEHGIALPVSSLGMSDDLESAIAHGSTLVRVGTAIFGPRPQFDAQPEP